MVVLAIARVLLALVTAALLFPWVMRRWILRLLLFGTIVYVGLPIQADQSVFWTSGYTVMAQLESAYTTVAGAANKIAGCLDPALEMWNRVAAVLQAVLMVLTDWAGFEDGFRGARTPLTPVDYCTFSHRMRTAIERFILLVEVPVFLFFDVVEGLISVVSDVLDLEFWEVLVGIFVDAFEELTGLDVCFSSWQGGMYCLCSPPFRRIWDSPADVPDNFLKAWTKCIYPPYDVSQDPILYGLNVVFGFTGIINGYNALCGAYTALGNKVQSIYNIAEDAYGFLEDAIGSLNYLNSLLDTLSLPTISFDDILAPLGLKLDQARAIMETITLAECPSFSTMEPLAVARAPAAAREKPAVASLRALGRSAAAVFLERLPGAWDRALARAGMDAAEHRLWMRVLAVATEALRAPAPVPARVLADRMRAAGVDFSALPAAPSPRCVAHRAALAGRAAPRAVALIDDSWITAATGALVIAFSTVVLAILFPPSIAFLIGLTALYALSTVALVLSGAAFGMVSAVATGQLERAVALPAIIYTAQYVGRAYATGGLLSLDGIAYISGLMPEIELDVEYMFQLLSDRPACTGLVTPFCLPAPVRGEGAIDRLVGAIQCHQDQPCNDVSDCAGRAKACVANKCLCWMYMPVGVRLPTLTIAYAASPACEAYGYTNDGLLPRQTGGLSWTNVANTFANFRAAVRDLLRALAHAYFPYGILGVAVFTFVPFIRGTAKALTRYAVVFCATQAALTYANDALGLVSPPDHGLACAAYALPSVVLWAGLLVALGALAAAVLGSGILVAALGLLWALACLAGRAATFALRLGRPYAQWWRSNR